MNYEPIQATQRQLSAEEIAIFRECFNEYVRFASLHVHLVCTHRPRRNTDTLQDQDRGGNISVEEFGRVMRKTNPSISDAEVAKIISEVDLDGDGTINFDEFITMMTGQPYKSPEAAPKAECNIAPPSANSAAAVRGVSTLSARLQRQRLANQVFKDAWAAVDPTLKGVLGVEQVRGVAQAAGLAVADEEFGELKGEGQEGITCECTFLCPYCGLADWRYSSLLT